MIRINPGFLPDQQENYAKTAAHMLHDHSELVDCSLGINPYGISRRVTDHLTEFDLAHIHQYPISNEELKQRVQAYWTPTAHFDTEQIHFAHGAMGALELINRILLTPSSRVLGSCPQFTDYMFDVEKCGARFDYVPLDSGRNYRFDPDRFMEAIGSVVDAIYLDNPNNPTGQVVPLADIARIVARAKKFDCAVIIDEAYGDYMPDGNSAIRLLEDHDNLLVVRSFSKAFGMAGLRVGYAVVPKSLAPHFEKATIAFPINALGQFFTAHVLEDRSFVIESVRRITQDKRRIREELGKLRLLETCDELPIMTLVHPDPDAALYELFLDQGILTTCCRSYVNLSGNAVRLRVPQRVEPVLAAIREIERMI